MMTPNQIITIVEGDGEVDAFPALIQRLLRQRGESEFVVPRAKNAHGGGNLKKAGGIERFVRYAWIEKLCAGVIVLIDGDDSAWPCAVKLATDLAKRIAGVGALKPTAVVVATKEYEAWFLASSETITADREYFPKTVIFEGDPEQRRGAKQRVGSAMHRSIKYKETEHQLIFTRLLCPELAARRSRSFRRLESALDELMAAVRHGERMVTPVG